MRFIEVDLIKGVAVIFMVIFHFFYLAYFMDVKKYNISSGILRFLAKSAHTTFIIMVGINLVLSYQRSQVMNRDADAYFGKQVKRSFMIFGAGIIISVLSYLSFGDMFVKFGIFQFIATAILISQLVVHNKLYALIAMIIIVALTFLKNKISNLYDTCLKMPLICFITGLYNVKYSSLDHFPLLPYLAFIFLGIFVGHNLYINFKRNFNGSVIDRNTNNNGAKTLAYFGRHSLMIYFIHFPLFYFILLAYKKLTDQTQPIINSY